jgi:hypothetical protein
MTDSFSKRKYHKTIDNIGNLSIESIADTLPPYVYSNDRKYYSHETSYLNSRHVKTLFHTLQSFYDSGAILNRFVTIHVPKAWGNNPQEFITMLTNKTRKWLKWHDQDFAYIWVLEKGDIIGFHAHFLMYIPPHYLKPYRRKLKTWIGYENNIDLKTILYPAWGGLHDRTDVIQILNYMCKGLNPRQKANFPKIKTSHQGTFKGRRCGYSTIKREQK